MPLYRKKPVVIEAEQFFAEAPMPFRDQGVVCLSGDAWYIETLEGNMTVSEGDYVIKGVRGEFYPCKPEIFALTYEPAE